MNDIQPPYSEEAERAVIGAVLVDGAAFATVADFLHHDDFFLLRHDYVWQAMRNLNDRQEAIDYLTVIAELKALSYYEAIGGAAYVTRLAAETPSSMHAEFYGRIVQRASIRRKMLGASDDIRRIALDEANDIETAIAQASARVMQIQKPLRERFVILSEGVDDYFGRVLDAIEQPREILGIPWAINDLNNATLGKRPGKLYVTAGRPGMGKSSHLITEAAADACRGLKVGFFTLEMPHEEVIENIVGGAVGINPQRLTSGKVTGEEYSQFVKGVGALAHWPVFIDDTPALTPAQLRARCHLLKNEKGLDVVYVDYLQLMHGGGETHYNNRDQEIGYISRSLKQLAKELRVPVIAAAQLSREVEKRADKRPMLSDLRESGNIENDADVVMFYYREDYYEPDMQEGPISRVEINIAKHRGGSTGRIDAGFRREIRKFVNVEIERRNLSDVL